VPPVRERYWLMGHVRADARRHTDRVVDNEARDRRRAGEALGEVGDVLFGFVGPKLRGGPVRPGSGGGMASATVSTDRAMSNARAHAANMNMLNNKNRLIAEVGPVNPRNIVVLKDGSPMLMP
jgi:hypothetical protein